MDENLLQKLYASGLSGSEIGKIVGHSQGWVSAQMRAAGIRARGNAESVHLALRAPPLTKSTALQELVDGLLLGDASIEQGATGSRLRLVQTLKHRPWIRQVRKQLEASDVALTTVELKAGEVEFNGKNYQRNRAEGFRSLSYTYFTEERKRWYPEGTKRVPKDVRLTPLSIAHWYFGDGTVGCKGYHAKFCTDGFITADVEYLMERLNITFGWNPIREERNRILLCKTTDRASLLNMVQPLTPSCFRHKLKLKIEDRRFSITGKTEMSVRHLRKGGLGYGAIATRLGLSKSGVYSACVRLGL